MYSDKDIKIAGDKPSRDVKRNSRTASDEINIDKALIGRAREWGKAIALKFIEDVNSIKDNEDAADCEMIIQRRMLLSFTATVGFEQFTDNDTLSGISQKSFIDTVRDFDAELYRTSSDTGAFSFYYLAFRRGSDVERRIGQTFAMLCSHDGDPVYQELGEALYCWFLSVVKQTAAELKINDSL